MYGTSLRVLIPIWDGSDNVFTLGAAPLFICFVADMHDEGCGADTQRLGHAHDLIVFVDISELLVFEIEDLYFVLE